MTFREFVHIIHKALYNGELKVSRELSLLDLAVQYAIGEAMNKEHKDTFTLQEISDAIKKYCGEDIWMEVMKED